MFGTNDVSWSNYRGMEGFGPGSQDDVDTLNKALTVGNAINPPSSAVPGDGFALRVESLESTLKNTQFRVPHVKLWKALPKKAAYNTVEEYNRLLSYGTNPDAGFFAEGALPNSDDATYQREYSIVKFLGTTRSVSHQSTLIKAAHGPVIANEAINGTMHLLRMIERYLFWGDSTLTQSGSNGLQWDGFITMALNQAPASNIIDMRDKPLNEDVLSDGSMTFNDAPNYGTPTHLFSTPKAKSDLCKSFYPKERYDALQRPRNGMVGLDIAGFESPAGDVLFESDIFLNDLGPCNPAILGNPLQVPSVFTVTTAAAAATDAASQFFAADQGTYYYYVVAANQYGKSAPVQVNSSALQVNAGQSVSFAVTPGAIVPDWWEIYRTRVGAAPGTQRLINRFGNTQRTAATTVLDENATIPGTSVAIMFQMDEETVAFKQLAPMVKVPLAIVDTSIRWMQLIYGVPMLYVPGRILIYKNVGRAFGSVGSTP